MKWDLVVNASKDQLYIRDFRIRPISDLIAYNIIDEDLLIRPHQMNITKFYDKTKADFYTAKANPDLLSDWPIVIPEHQKEKYEHIQTWDDTYWSGTQRMPYSIYKTTHEIMIPLWLEAADANDIEIIIELTPEGKSNSLVSKKLTFRPHTGSAYEYHNRFCEYIQNYFKYIGIGTQDDGTKGNNYCMKVDIKKNQTYLYGLNVQDGNMQTRTDFNITRNLLYRERPLLESNSLLTNAFADTHLILPQLINLNICFNALNWIPTSIRRLFTTRFSISVNVKVNNKTLKKCDLYTNHHFVPRPVNEDVAENNSYFTELPLNALDYKHDYKCTDLMHKNKIVQPICHWQMRDNPDVLFNLYDGFGASYGDYIINHFFGAVNDINDTTTDPVVPNTSPFGAKKYGDGDEVEYVLNNVEHYFDEEHYFISLADGWSNGFRIKYEPEPSDEIQDILIAGMTTPLEFERGYFKTGDTQFVTNPDYFAVWAKRFNSDGDDNLVDMRFREEGDDPRTDYDKQYDVALYHDMDNRWAGWDPVNHVDINQSPWHRREVNSYGIYFCPKIIDWPRKGPDAKALVLLIWDQQVEEGNTSQGYIYKSKYSLQNIGFIIESLREYIAWVKTTEKYQWMINEGDGLPEGFQLLLQLIDALSKLDGLFKVSEFPSVWYFLNTIYERQDNSASDKAEEIRYKKGKALDAYVFRFDGHIQPAIYPPVAFVNNDGNIAYTKKFGLNYFWRKAVYNKENIDFNVHARTGVPPKYPSIHYDCVISNADYKEGDGTSNITNALMYDYPLYDELVNSETQIKKEYKWFNKSLICQYPISLIAEAESLSATSTEAMEQALRDMMYAQLKQKVGDELYDEQYVKSIYDIKYELLNVHYSNSEPKQLLYKYKITMTLK